MARSSRPARKRAPCSRVAVFDAVGLCLRSAPCYARHLITAPYRREHTGSPHHQSTFNLGKRHRAALFDTGVNLLLDGYCQVTGFSLSSGSGRMALLYYEWMACLDDSVEYHAHRGEIPRPAMLLGEPAASHAAATWRRYLRDTHSDGAIAARIDAQLQRRFPGYLARFVATSQVPSFDNVHALVMLDSGLVFGTVLGEILALYNDHYINRKALRELYLFGMAGKFADDMIDLAHDMENDCPNLLFALLNQNGQEVNTVRRALRHNIRFSTKWWMTNCPRTYVSYMIYRNSYYDRISSPKIRLACDLMMLVALSAHRRKENRRRWPSD